MTSCLGKLRISIFSSSVRGLEVEVESGRVLGGSDRELGLEEEELGFELGIWGF